MTTNPPTETVSDPTYLFHPDNHLLDKKPTESDKDMEWTTNPPTEPAVEKWELLEKLAEIEHDQWIEWSSDIIHKENISKERTDRWTRLQFTDYKALTEEEKEQDRKYARKVLEVLSHSLQEAKAEGYKQGGLDCVSMIAENGEMPWETRKARERLWILMWEDKLASLKQEEGE